MKLSQHHASEIVKLLLVGDSGSGKTGSLASLANAGYELFIADFDNGADILHELVNKEAQSRVNIEVFTDKMTVAANGEPIPEGMPRAYMDFVGSLKKWVDRETKKDFGSITKWGPERVLVVDSATLLGRAAMHYVKFVNNAITERDWGYYGPVMEIEEKLLELLYSQQVRCNVIVTAHIIGITDKQRTTDDKGRPITVDVGEPKGYPSFMGNKLPPKVGRYFNTILQVKSHGGRRWIETKQSDDIEVKTCIPKSCPSSLKLEDGLATYFGLVKKAASGGK